MKLIGPWFSGFTRRVGVTMKLLDIDFEHVSLHAYLQRDEVRAYSPMGKVPALVLDDGQTLYDSWSIIDYLHEQVGPRRALLAASGSQRRDALQYIAVATAIYGKLSTLYDESLRPEEQRSADLSEIWLRQALAGFGMLEARAGNGWLVGSALSQADIMVVVSYQTASMGVLPGRVDGNAYPRLAALSERAMQLPAFATTSPFAATA